jgi:hypothetical protein
VSFYTKNVHFTKTGSGQTPGKLKKDGLSYLTDKERPHGLSGKKSVFLRNFDAKNDHFAKTGSGQTPGKHSRKERRAFSDRYVSHSIRCWER